MILLQSPNHDIASLLQVKRDLSLNKLCAECKSISLGIRNRLVLRLPRPSYAHGFIDPMAAAYAVLNFVDEDWYLEIARKKIGATRKLLQGIRKHKDLILMSEPDFCIFFLHQRPSVFFI